MRPGRAYGLGPLFSLKTYRQAFGSAQHGEGNALGGGVAAVDYRVWMDDRLQTLVGVFDGSINLDFYGAGEASPLKDHPLTQEQAGHGTDGDPIRAPRGSTGRIGVAEASLAPRALQP